MLRHTLPDRRAVLLAACACWLGFALLVALVLSGGAEAFDAAGLVLWRTADGMPRGPGWLEEGVRDLTGLGGVTLRNAAALVAAAVLLHLRRGRAAAFVVLTVGGGWAFNTGLKLLFGRDRPDLVTPLMEAGGPGFPSGHAFNGTVVWLAIALAFVPLAATRLGRVSLVWGAMLLTPAIAWSRVWLGVHYPSDVLAGWLGGAGWTLLAWAVLLTARQARSEPPAA
ncbi:phosphatase PAP2 family protein [Qipengyuania thermophila]|uniref:phosphatase PAP2 family protein n=1 Tax=Qipengyuania thermophila TaxID=2509361 RepID=UPI001F23BF79|nr:phosphatase PAP2 family protein [Qipengyuania thermophila]